MTTPAALPRPRPASARRTARPYAPVPGVIALAAVAALLGLLVLAAPAHADQVRNDQWQLGALDVRNAWHYSTGEGVVVAVLDSGVDAGHPDLAGQVLPGADFVDGSTDGRRDFVGHGTTVAALIAGRADDTSGVEGLAPKAKILPVRVLDEQNKYDDATVVAGGLRWAVDHGARVVNMSLGGTARSDALADAIAYASAHDVVVIACTGNLTDGSGTQVWFPAREPGVVAVTGLTVNAEPRGTGGAAPAGDGGTGGAAPAGATLWAGSLTGPQTVLAAPAVNLLGARPGGYWRVQGTSFAAPLVAASAVLVRSRWPGMDAPNVINRLIRTARDLGPTGRDPRYGYGEVNPAAALTTTLPSVAANPLTGAPVPASAATTVVDAATAGTDVDPHAPPLARAGSAIAVTDRTVFSAGVGAVVFMLLLSGGLALVRRRGRA